MYTFLPTYYFSFSIYVVFFIYCFGQVIVHVLYHVLFYFSNMFMFVSQSCTCLYMVGKVDLGIKVYITNKFLFIIHLSYNTPLQFILSYIYHAFLQSRIIILFPTLFSTLFPTLFPTLFSTLFLTLFPTLFPTLFSTLFPTLFLILL